MVRRSGASWSRGVFTFVWWGFSGWVNGDGPASDADAGIGSGNEAWVIPPSRSESFHSVLAAAETGATKKQTRNSKS